MPSRRETRPPEELATRPAKGPSRSVVAWLGFGTALVTFMGAVLLTLLPYCERRKTSQPALTLPPVPASPGWKYEEFIEKGGAGAAERLSEETEQPLPQNVVATAPAAEKICVWWKPSPGSHYKYQYAQILWDKNHPVATAALPPDQVPIGFGGKNYELFLFFSVTKPPSVPATP